MVESNPEYFLHIENSMHLVFGVHLQICQPSASIIPKRSEWKGSYELPAPDQGLGPAVLLAAWENVEVLPGTRFPKTLQDHPRKPLYEQDVEILAGTYPMGCVFSCSRDSPMWKTAVDSMT